MTSIPPKISIVFGKVYVIANFSRTRRILDILYSAQHGNPHKDAFA